MVEDTNIPLRDLKIYQTLAIGDQGTDILAEWKNKFVVIKKLNWTPDPSECERNIFLSELEIWKYVLFLFIFY